MSGRMKILMLASVASMIDQFNMSNIRLLLEMGYEVHAACNYKEGNTCDAERIRGLRKRLHSMRVVQHQWDCPRSVYALGKCGRACRQLWRLTGKEQFAWIHCHSPVGGALARLVGHLRGSRVMYTVHGFHFYQGAPLWNWLLYYPVEKMLSYWTDVLITVNQEDYRLAKRRMHAGKVYRIPGVGIDISRFQRDAGIEAGCFERDAFRAACGIPADAVVLLSVGELSRRKNHQAVIAALAKLSRQDVYYLICGQGACRDRLMRTAERYGVAHRVRLAGFLEDVEQAYRSCDIFVFPSLQEGFPAALMEAMAAGMPCVVSAIRGNRELICNKGGRKFPVTGRSSVRTIRRYLEELIADLELREACGRYNQNKIKAYDILVVEGYMKQIYESMSEDLAVQQKTERKVKAPKISVIMAVYNASDGKMLRAAVDSICRQTYTDWELIICDDGSTDGTWRILQNLAGKDPRIRLLRNVRNRRAGAARNACLKKARGRYIAVMDADDISSPDRLEKQHQFLEQHRQYAFAGSRGEYFIREPGDDGENYWFCPAPGAEDFLFSLPYVHASVMFRRTALENVHGYDGAACAVRAEDYDLLLRLYHAGFRGANLDQVLYYIRRDRAQYQRRRYRYRFLEAYVKFRGFRKLGLMPKGLLYAAKPFLAGLLPHRLAAVMQKYYYRNRQA